MSRQYWLDLFTGKTWEEFLKNGATVSGFRESRASICKQIKVGDYLICYVTGVSRFIGVLEVLSESYPDYDTRIWSDSLFPIRFKVKIIYKLVPETAVPVLQLRDKLSIFKKLKTSGQWSGFFRGSPARFNPDDAETVIQAIHEAAEHPQKRDYDKGKYWKSPKIYKSSIERGTAPDRVEKDTKKFAIEATESEKVTHEEIQWLLLKLGSDLGLDVWVARNDRNKEYNGSLFQEIPRLLKTLPRQFDEETSRTIEHIDVLWLQGNAILAAFEVEHTTQIYSGLLRMSDLVAMQSNLYIDLYVVAPDERRDKVMEEIRRPTFNKREPRLTRICKYISYSKLRKEIEEIGHRIIYTNPDFIKDIAESCEPGG